MPIMLTRKDGPPTPFRNAEYIPFYYFIPKSILSRCGAELNAIPRNPQELFHNRAACEFVKSDLFRLLIIDAVAFMRYGGDRLLACVQKPESHAGLRHNPDKTTAPEYLDEDLYAALRYAENDDKTDRKIFVGGINCSAPST